MESNGNPPNLPSYRDQLESLRAQTMESSDGNTGQESELRDRGQRLETIQAETLRDLPDALRAALGPDDRGRFRGLLAKVEDLIQRLEDLHRLCDHQSELIRELRRMLTQRQSSEEVPESARSSEAERARRLAAGLSYPTWDLERLVVGLQQRVIELDNQVQTLHSQNQELSGQLALQESFEEPDTVCTRPRDNAKASKGLAINERLVKAIGMFVDNPRGPHNVELSDDDLAAIRDIITEHKIFKNRNMALRFRAQAAADGVTSSRRVAKDITSVREGFKFVMEMICSILERRHNSS